MNLGKGRGETSGGRFEDTGGTPEHDRDNPGTPSGTPNDFPKYPPEAIKLGTEIRLKNRFAKAGKRLAPYMTDNPTQPQEMYWLSRSVDRLVTIVEGLAEDVEQIKRERATEKALDRVREGAVVERQQKFSKIQMAALSTGIAMCGWILREIVSPLLAHLRK